MSCGLNERELFVLNLLYSKRCLARDKSFHSKKLERLFRKEFEEQDDTEEQEATEEGDDFDEVVKSLRNRAYLGEAGKSPKKYYISDVKQALIALGQHNFNVTKGRERRL